MPHTDSTYAIARTTTLDFDAAVAAARAALAGEGFGVLCEIDVQATLREKLGAVREPYVILGACNPPLAHQALETDPQIGVLLPCNVVVYVEDGTTHVAAIDAAVMLGVVGSAELEPIAADVRGRLERVIEAID